jgi:hypothetical protein
MRLFTLSSALTHTTLLTQAKTLLSHISPLKKKLAFSLYQSRGFIKAFGGNMPKERLGS